MKIDKLIAESGASGYLAFASLFGLCAFKLKESPRHYDILCLFTQQMVELEYRRRQNDTGT